MSVLDPLEVAESEVGPFWDLERPNPVTGRPEIHRGAMARLTMAQAEYTVRRDIIPSELQERLDALADSRNREVQGTPSPIDVSGDDGARERAYTRCVTISGSSLFADQASASSWPVPSRVKAASQPSACSGIAQRVEAIVWRIRALSASADVALATAPPVPPLHLPWRDRRRCTTHPE